MEEKIILKETIHTQKNEIIHRTMIAEEDMKVTLNYLIIKRVMDILISVFGLIILSPLFIMIALSIKVENPKGPVFFRQTRVGKNGQEFKIYKFRSMVINAEEMLHDLLQFNEVEGAMFKMKEDPRVTKVGSFIRRTSIDELPQLWNVLKGEMSLVGPRPPLLREVVEYTAYDKQRLLVTPGCTGLWQVSGRSNLSFGEMVKLDIDYIKRRTILFDIDLLFKTIIVVLSKKSAY